jgi:hypothetical protein
MIRHLASRLLQLIIGWRVDTYLYNDLNFMNRCNATLYAYYPKAYHFWRAVGTWRTLTILCLANIQILYGYRCIR